QASTGNRQGSTGHALLRPGPEATGTGKCRPYLSKADYPTERHYRKAGSAIGTGAERGPGREKKGARHSTGEQGMGAVWRTGGTLEEKTDIRLTSARTLPPTLAQERWSYSSSNSIDAELIQ